MKKKNINFVFFNFDELLKKIIQYVRLSVYVSLFFPKIYGESFF